MASHSHAQPSAAQWHAHVLVPDYRPPPPPSRLWRCVHTCYMPSGPLCVVLVAFRVPRPDVPLMPCDPGCPVDIMLDTRSGGSGARIGAFRRRMRPNPACIRPYRRAGGASGRKAGLLLTTWAVIAVAAFTGSVAATAPATRNANETSVGLGTARRLATCSAGHYEDRRGVCLPCPEGTYLPGEKRSTHTVHARTDTTAQPPDTVPACPVVVDRGRRGVHTVPQAPLLDHWLLQLLYVPH